MSLDSYNHIQKIIESGVDEFFEQVFEKNYISLSDEEFNYLLILSCEKNEYEMAKIIYTKSKELETTKTKYFIFTQKHKIITNITLDICLLRAINNRNIIIYNWLKSIEANIPEDKLKLFFSNACKSGVQEIIYDIYNSYPESCENYIESGLKISLEQGNYEIFKFIKSLGYYNKGKWIFRYYLKNPKRNLDLFYYLYYNYHNYIDVEILMEILDKNRYEEIKIIFTYQNYPQKLVISLATTYIKNKSIDTKIIKLLIDYIYDISIRIKLLIDCVLTKGLFIEEVKDLVEYSKYNNEFMIIVFDVVYKEYSKELEPESRSGYKYFLEYLIDNGYEPKISNEFYYYYLDKKEKVMLEKL